MGSIALPIVISHSAAISVDGGRMPPPKTAATDIEIPAENRRIQDGGESTIEVSPALSVAALLGTAFRGLTAEDEERAAEGFGTIEADADVVSLLSAHVTEQTLPEAVRRLALLGLGRLYAGNPTIARRDLVDALRSSNPSLIDAGLRAIDGRRVPDFASEVRVVADREDMPRWLRDYAADLLG